MEKEQKEFWGWLHYSRNILILCPYKNRWNDPAAITSDKKLEKVIKSI